MYSFPNLEPDYCSMSGPNCCFLTYVQISQESGQGVWYSHLFQNFPQFIVMHTVRGFGIVNKAEIDVSLELSCFFYDPADVGNLISGSSAFSKTSLNIWKFTIHVLPKPGLENFEHKLKKKKHLQNLASHSGEKPKSSQWPMRPKTVCISIQGWQVPYSLHWTLYSSTSSLTAFTFAMRPTWNTGSHVASGLYLRGTPIKASQWPYMK